MDDHEALGIASSVAREVYLMPKPRTHDDRLFFRYTVDCEHHPVLGTAFYVRGRFIVDLNFPYETSILEGYSVVEIGGRKKLLAAFRTVSEQAVGDYIAANWPIE